MYGELSQDTLRNFPFLAKRTPGAAHSTIISLRFTIPAHFHKAKKYLPSVFFWRQEPVLQR